MLITRQDVDQRIDTLNSFGVLTQPETIELARLRLHTGCEDVHNEKERLTDLGIRPGLEFDREVLKNIRDILFHTRDYWPNETDQDYLGSLDCIARQSLLLNKTFSNTYNQHYNPISPSTSEEINLWRNLGFLVQCQVSRQGFGVAQEIPISHEDVRDLLEELVEKLLPLLEREIAYLEGQHVNGINAIRTPFRNPQQLPNLHAFTTHRREVVRLKKMQHAIQMIERADLTRAIHRMAFLRQLQAIGESMGSKNLSAVAKSLTLQNDRDLGGTVDWGLFINLRNKLSHLEWDYRSQHLRAQLNGQILGAVRGDITLLGREITRVQAAHNVLTQDRDSFYRRYSGQWFLRDKTKEIFKTFIATCQSLDVFDGDKAAELVSCLDEGIRGRDLFVNEKIKPAIDHILNPPETENCEPPPAELKDQIRRGYQKLLTTYKNELWLCKNRENPEGREKNGIERSLANQHTHIRTFFGALDFSEAAYKTDLATRLPPARDFTTQIELISLFREEIAAMNLVLAEALTLNFPENLVDIPMSEPLRQELFTKIPDSIADFRSIQEYCKAIGSPSFLQMEGLPFGARAGDISHSTSDCLFQDLPWLKKQIAIQARKCRFYMGLIRDPLIVDGALFHMAKAQKYLSLLSQLRGIPPAQIPFFQEIKALRDYIGHGLDLMDSKDQPLHVFMVRYAVMFTRQISTAIDGIHARVIQDQAAANP